MTRRAPIALPRGPRVPPAGEGRRPLTLTERLEARDAEEWRAVAEGLERRADAVARELARIPSGPLAAEPADYPGGGAAQDERLRAAALEAEACEYLERAHAARLRAAALEAAGGRP